ncbi:hypothetical protein M9H77_14066 [Catharanthus roseus]|uniref:Uncharacterized protein n=1 Tax=Catharanthus roseus TaxID=4058 RepID=A0ACC0BLY7_CATRO|nr:hypothetical protein M9H77_14066 [Catharanthus roseus]
MLFNFMVRPDAHRGDDDLGPVTDRTGRVECLTVTVSSKVQEFLTQFSSPGRKLGAKLFNQLVGGVPPDSSYSTHDYASQDYGISSSEPFLGDSGDISLEGGRGLDPEPVMVGSLQIGGDDDERVHDDDDDNDDITKYFVVLAVSIEDCITPFNI